jgi:hypothetical protein
MKTKKEQIQELNKRRLAVAGMELPWRRENPPKKDLRILYVILGVLILLDISFLVVYGITAFIVTRPVEFAGSIECNTGKIGVDYESFYNNSLSRQNITLLNETYDFNKIVGWTPEKFNLKGVDNLYCKAQFNTKNQIINIVPFLEILMGGGDK